MPSISDSKSNALDIAIKKINQHTELHISSKFGKKGKAFKNVIFMVKPQALAETIPFDLVPGAATPGGLKQHQVGAGGECWPATDSNWHHHAWLGGHHLGQCGSGRGLQQVRSRPENGQTCQGTFPLGAAGDDFGLPFLKRRLSG